LQSVPDYYTPSDIPGFVPFTEEQKTAARDVLASIADVINVTFTETSGIGQITFGNYSFANTPNEGSSGLAWSPSGTGKPGDVWINAATDWHANGLNGWAPGPGGNGYATLIHEIGHALGLKHPHTGDYVLTSDLDREPCTVMSYTMHSQTNVVMSGDYSYFTNYVRAATLMPLDMEALQYLYGANQAANTGNDVYRWEVNQEFLETIWDAGGKDAIDCSNQIYGNYISLAPGSSSSIGLRQTNAAIRDAMNLADWITSFPSDIYTGKDNLAIAKGVIIENAVGGSGNDTLLGNTVNNQLTGNAGNDILLGDSGWDNLAGGDGLDSLEGGYGNDTLYGNLDNDTLSGGGGNDSLYGGWGDDVLYGGAGKDSLSGAGNNDTLTGGADADTMSGGAGNDLYSVDNAGDRVVELANEGVDTVYAAVSHTLAANVEHLALTGASAINGTGNALANLITGNSVRNVLSGLDADDTLRGADGNDSLYGGLGWDRLEGGNGWDRLDGGNGNDTLYGNIGNDNLNGGAGNDSLYGGWGDDSLYGGAGKDSLKGEGGNDVFVFKAAADSAPTAADTILDFASGDKLDFTGFDARAGISGMQKFGFIGTSAFSAAGQIRFVYNATSKGGMVYASNDADTDAEFAVTLAGVSNLTEADFIL
jgi:serralysin